MNKIIIPSIFAGIVIVAAAFAVMPIEKASTVHTTIGGNINKQDRYLSFQLSTGNAAVTDAVIIPGKTGQELKVAIEATVLDGAGTISFEDTAGTSVTADGTVQTIATGEGLQIASAGANSDYLISIVVAESAE